MASFYDSASIITIPSGYKVGTLYSAKPTDGTGDMTFTRTGDTATRVNSAGIIERCITNYLLQSNNFSSVNWTKNNITLGTGITDPNGGTTAFSITGSSSTSNGKNVNQSQLPSSSDIKTITIYAKANTHSFLQLRLSATGFHVNFDLTNGTFSNGASGVGKMTSIGGGWYRCQMTTAAVTTGVVSAYQLVDSLSAATNEASTTTNSVYIWRAQGELGDFATNYIDTTTAAVTTGPVTNLPRLDYFGSTCPQLLMEPTRTNLVPYSQMFSNAVWSKDGVTINDNVLVSPDGYTNADVMTEDTSSSGHRLARGTSWVSGTTYTMSCFVKQGSGTRRLGFYVLGNAFGTALFANFNIQTGVVTTTNSSITGKIENYGNGWFRCIATATATATISSSFYLYLRQTDAAITSAYTGDGTSSLYLWGAQVEAGAYATSYIPTTAATVTRNNDNMQKTSITSLIGQTEGTLFLNFKFTGTEDGYFSVGDGTTGNRIVIGTQIVLRRIRALITNATISQVDISSDNGSLVIGNSYKMAIAYKENDVAVYLNGSLIATDTTATIPACPNLYFSAASSQVRFVEPVVQALIFKTRLTNDQLATLTTL
jgi:hypothetical protein